MDLSNKYPFFEEKENRIYKDIEGLKNILLEGKNVQKGIEFLNILKKEFEH
ncbi:MAG TPA: hypothetical protein PK800_03670 [Syntrophorhabdaceae bacterium]|nr:hypothetical protein [Syntrophorhabdaceae bacterium]